MAKAMSFMPLSSDSLRATCPEPEPHDGAGSPQPLPRAYSSELAGNRIDEEVFKTIGDSAHGLNHELSRRNLVRGKGHVGRP